MNNNALSPYIRVAKFHSFSPKFHLARRIIYDYELIYACGGGARLVIGDDVHICKKNDVILLRPGVTHDLIHLDDLKFVQPHIHFDMFCTEQSANIPVSFKDISDFSEAEKKQLQRDFFGEHKPPFIYFSDIERAKSMFYSIVTQPKLSVLSQKAKL